MAPDVEPAEAPTKGSGFAEPRDKVAPGAAWPKDATVEFTFGLPEVGLQLLQADMQQLEDRMAFT